MKLSIDVKGGGATGSLAIDVGFTGTTWEAITPRAFGSDGGKVANWGTSDAHLHDRQATPVMVLHGLSKSVEPNQEGTGEKLNPEGAIQSGDVTWICKGVS
jgi:hypothetical protein